MNNYSKPRKMPDIFHHFKKLLYIFFLKSDYIISWYVVARLCKKCGIEHASSNSSIKASMYSFSKNVSRKKKSIMFQKKYKRLTHQNSVSGLSILIKWLT